MILNYNEKFLKEIKLKTLLDIFFWSELRQKYDIDIFDFYSFFITPFHKSIDTENSITTKILANIPNQIVVFNFLAERNALLLSIKAITKQNGRIKLKNTFIEPLNNFSKLGVSIAVLMYVSNSKNFFYLDTPINIIQNSNIVYDKKKKIKFYELNPENILKMEEFLEINYGIESNLTSKIIQNLITEIEKNNYFEILKANKS
ncbi:MAG: hypothetical protein RMJ67_01420 [Elusimicrobiota bacterium]|nr:hypothetical protein [Endomicrobiia bacterium]MDW8165164.1 hypothetical protein [Elusimicrobiota bacterium]